MTSYKGNLKKIALVIPVSNEENNILQLSQELIVQIQKFHHKINIIFVIDNASNDKTRFILNKIAVKNSNISLIYESKNKNVVDAYARGFKEAIANKYDYVIEMDAGFSHLPSELLRFIDKIDDGGYDAIFGKRPLWSPRYKVKLSRRIYSLCATIFPNFLLGMKFKDISSGYEAFTLKTLEKVISKPFISTGHSWHIEVKYRCRNLNYAEIPITYNFPSNTIALKTLINSAFVLFSLCLDRLNPKT